MNYPSIRIEDVILADDILERLEDAAWQKPGDFGVLSLFKRKKNLTPQRM